MKFLNSGRDTLPHEVIPSNIEVYLSNDEGTLESEIVSSDGMTSIKNFNLKKFFSNDKNTFSQEGFKDNKGALQMHNLTEIQVVTYCLYLEVVSSN
jgi:hypothetical protein